MIFWHATGIVHDDIPTLKPNFALFHDFKEAELRAHLYNAILIQTKGTSVAVWDYKYCDPEGNPIPGERRTW